MMSKSTRHGLPCHWRNCSAPGPYDDDKALYDHLNAAHNTKFGSFRCQWNGCARTTPILGRSSGAEHLGTHTDHRPYVCSLPGCGYAALRRQSMRKHVTTEHSLPSATAGDKLECLWIRCDQTFSKDDDGAGELWEHMLEHHNPILGPGEAFQCQWGRCTRNFERGFSVHLRSHLPKWYRPFKCTTCGRAFAAASPLVMHEKNSHSYRNDTPESEDSDSGEGDGRHGKRDGKKRRRSPSDELESDEEDYTAALKRRVEELEGKLDGMLSEQKAANKKARRVEKEKDSHKSESKAPEEEEWALS